MTDTEQIAAPSPRPEVEQPATGDVAQPSPVASPDYSEPAPDVHGLADLDRHALQIRYYRAQLARVQESFRAEMERMRDRLAERERILNERIAWHEAPIESYHRAHPKDRTLTLAHGNSKLRAAPVRAFIEDAAAVHRWALEHHPEITKPPGVSDVRKVLAPITSPDDPAVDAATGEIVPGLKVEKPDDTWLFDTEPGEPF